VLTQLSGIEAGKPVNVADNVIHGIRRMPVTL
jgi:hypothetical protein